MIKDEQAWYNDYVTTVKKYNALIDITKKYQEILNKKSISRLVSSKNKQEIIKLIDGYLSI